MARSVAPSPSTSRRCRGPRRAGRRRANQTSTVSSSSRSAPAGCRPTAPHPLQRGGSAAPEPRDELGDVLASVRQGGSIDILEDRPVPSPRGASRRRSATPPRTSPTSSWMKPYPRSAGSAAISCAAARARGTRARRGLRRRRRERARSAGSARRARSAVQGGERARQAARRRLEQAVEVELHRSAREDGAPSPRPARRAAGGSLRAMRAVVRAAEDERRGRAGRPAKQPHSQPMSSPQCQRPQLWSW